MSCHRFDKSAACGNTAVGIWDSISLRIEIIDQGLSSKEGAFANILERMGLTFCCETSYGPGGAAERSRWQAKRSHRNGNREEMRLKGAGCFHPEPPAPRWGAINVNCKLRWRHLRLATG